MEKPDSQQAQSTRNILEYLPSCPGISKKILPIIGVEFSGNRRQLFNNPMEFPFRFGDMAVVRVEKGEDLGKVVHLLDRLPDNQPKPEYEVLRRATGKDLKTLEEYRSKEGPAKQICKEKIANHGLEMKLVDVEYQFDGRKLIFYFTADGRIDFRQLVKDLAATFRTRIELRQIGARDETRRLGGLGPCGRHLCCAVFITEFCPITTQMAKDQNLPLNPNKISGNCGRLKCCLNYELEEYHKALLELPRWDTAILTKKGPAQVEKLDIFNRAIFLRFESGDLIRVEVRELKDLLSKDFKPHSLPDEGSLSNDSSNEVISDDAPGNSDGSNAASETTGRKSQKQKAIPQHQSKNKHQNTNVYKNRRNRHSQSGNNSNPKKNHHR